MFQTKKELRKRIRDLETVISEKDYAINQSQDCIRSMKAELEERRNFWQKQVTSREEKIDIYGKSALEVMRLLKKAYGASIEMKQ